MFTSINSEAGVVGAGPNGLAAGIEMARAGYKTTIFEVSDTAGGGLRTAELTNPGFKHDICSAVHPLGAASPFFRSLNLEKYGLEFIEPPIPLAHPFDDGSAALLCHSIEDTIDSFSLLDRSNYRDLMSPIVRDWETLMNEILSPIHVPRSLSLVKFGARILLPASMLIRLLFRGYKAKGLMGGLSAHSFLPLQKIPSAAVGIMLGLLGHAVGWPIVKGGSQKFTDALVGYFLSLGGQLITGTEITNIDNLPFTKCALLDVTPKQFLKMTLSRKSLLRPILNQYHYGPSVFKIDWALNAPIPWRAEKCKKAGTVHIGGTLEEIEQSEKEVAMGLHPKKPFILLSQQSIFDSTRAPSNNHTGWAYCHVPLGSRFDMTERIENQIERFAPGFRDCIIGRSTLNAADHELYNPNFVGGDINGGTLSLLQIIFRPVPSIGSYRSGIARVFLCSSSTPPGPGVHGMCGYHAAQSAIKYLTKRR